jgi:molybdate transport system substrate-binding protein
MNKFLIIMLLSLGLETRADEIKVFAASSLMDALTSIGNHYAKETSTRTRFSFDASSRLAKQISEGAKADIFFSADKEWNNFLEEKKMVESGNSSDVLSNELSLVTHISNPIEVQDLATLGQIKFKTICLASGTVPAGKLAYETLKKTGMYSGIKSRIVHGDNARHVLAWVAKNEADLAMVFVTDAKAEKNVRELLRIPSHLHSPVIYTVSLIGNHPTKEALSFYRYLQQKTARSIFERYGFKMINK